MIVPPEDGSASGAGAGGNRDADPGVIGAGHQGGFAVPGNPCDDAQGRVDVHLPAGFALQGVDNPADAPSPDRQHPGEFRVHQFVGIKGIECAQVQAVVHGDVGGDIGDAGVAPFGRGGAVGGGGRRRAAPEKAVFDIAGKACFRLFSPGQGDKNREGRGFFAPGDGDGQLNGVFPGGFPEGGGYGDFILRKPSVNVMPVQFQDLFPALFPVRGRGYPRTVAECHQIRPFLKGRQQVRGGKPLGAGGKRPGGQDGGGQKQAENRACHEGSLPLCFCPGTGPRKARMRRMIVSLILSQGAEEIKGPNSHKIVKKT